MLQFTCPCCGGDLGELPEPERVRESLPPQEAKLFDLVLSSGVPGIPVSKLSIDLFGPLIGAEESKLQHVRVLVSRLRSKINRYGYFMPKASKGQPNIRIIPSEKSA